MKTMLILTISLLVYSSLTLGMEQVFSTSQMIPLFAALENKKSEQVQQIITEFPQTINRHHKYTNDSRILFGDVTPLHIAVYKDDKPSVQLLLAAGADCNAQTQGLCRKDTPLHLVKSSEIVELLIQHRASVYAKNRYGWTPLYTALFHPHCYYNLAVAQSLVAAGADVNERLKDNNDTLLHEAMTVFGNGTLLFLLANGADRTLLNDKGETALQAVQNRLPFVARENERSSGHLVSPGTIDAIIECLNAIPERK